LKRILFISISAPPKSGPESLQTGKYLSELSKYFSIDLVTTETSSYGWNKVVGKKELLLMPYINSLIELKGYSNRLFSKIKSWLPKQLKFPDDNFHFHTSAKHVIKKLENIPDAIYSRSSPLSSSILAFKIKEKINRPWIMHLSDPWVDNPFLNSNYERNKKWEETCFSSADIITVTNDNYLTFLKEKYPTYQHKFELSYNVYEPIKIKPIDFSQPLSLVYFGNFYGDRSPKVIIEAFSRIYNDSPKELDNVTVSFYGNLDANSQQIIDNANLPFVFHKGFIPFSKIVEVVADSTILINIEDQFTQLSDILFLPSKIMDYISYQRLILSISSNRSPSRSIINKKYGEVFEHDNIDGIVKFIKSTIKAYNEKNYDFFQVHEPDPLFSIEFQARKLMTKILSLK